MPGGSATIRPRQPLRHNRMIARAGRVGRSAQVARHGGSRRALIQDQANCSLRSSTRSRICGPALIASRRRPSLLYGGNNDEAKSVVAQLIRDVGFEPIDIGPLRIARYLEPFTLAIAQLAYEGDCHRRRPDRSGHRPPGRRRQARRARRPQRAYQSRHRSAQTCRAQGEAGNALLSYDSRHAGRQQSRTDRCSEGGQAPAPAHVVAVFAALVGVREEVRRSPRLDVRGQDSQGGIRDHQ